jgi:hypothetical protein
MMMRISEGTMDVLKNFSTINPSLAFKQGNTIRTVSEQKNILAQAVVEDAFPVDFAIYELNQFLGLASLFDNADFAFGEADVTIRDENNKSHSRYTYTDPSMVTSPPEKNLDMPDPEIQFSVTADDLKAVVSAANQLGLPEVVVRGGATGIALVATDMKNPTSNEYSRDVGESNGDIFNMVFKTENLKFISGDYDVKISKAGISHFKNISGHIEYWVATETNSEYE